MQIKKNKIFSDSLFITIGTLIKKIRGLIFLPIIIYYVGMNDYGAFVQIAINSRLLSPLCTMALGMGFMRFSSQYDHDIPKLSRDYWTIIIFSFIFALIGSSCIFITSPIISKYILGGDHLAALRLSSLFIINNTLWTQNNKFLKAIKKFKLFVVYDILYHILPYLGFVIGIVLYQSIFPGLMGFIIIQGVMVIILVIINSKRLKFVRPSIVVFKQFIKYTWPMPFSEITGGLLNKIDRYFIGFFFGTAAIGVYNIAFNIANLLYELTKPFILYFTVYMPKLWDKGKIKIVLEKLRTGLIYYLMLTAGILIILSCYSEQLLSIIIKGKIIFSVNFNLIVFLLGMGVLARGINAFYFEIIKYRKTTHIIFYLQTISAVINILLNYLIIPKLGLIGAAITTLITHFVICLLNIQLFSFSFTIVFLKKVMGIILSCFIIFIINIMFSFTNYWYLFAGIIGSSFLYVAMLFITNTISLKEIRTFQKFQDAHQKSDH